MNLTFGLATACDLFAKLQRDAAALDHEVTSDRFFNFVVTGYSMIDWIKNDPSVPVSAKAAIQDLYSDTSLKVCRDLATACKHFELKRHVPVASATTAAQGFGVGRFDKGSYGVGEQSIEVQLNDGNTYNCLDLAGHVLASWHAFFARHGMARPTSLKNK